MKYKYFIFYQRICCYSNNKNLKLKEEEEKQFFIITAKIKREIYNVLHSSLFFISLFFEKSKIVDCYIFLSLLEKSLLTLKLQLLFFYRYYPG